MQLVERYNIDDDYDCLGRLLAVAILCNYLQGVPKKIGFLSSFEFLGSGGVFLGVKNNSKNFGNKKNIVLFSKILSKCTLFYSKFSIIIQSL